MKVSTIFCISVLIVAVAAQPYKGWTNLFSPPFSTNPQVLSDIDCIDAQNCFLPGLYPGQSYNVYAFNGQMNGEFTLMNVSGGESLSLLGISVGSTVANTTGYSAGMDILGGGKYLLSGIWSTSFLLAGFTTLDVKVDKATGQNVYFFNNAAQPNGDELYTSKDGGITFTKTKIKGGKFPTPNCSFSRYTALTANGVLYQTFGGNPSSQGSGFQKRQSASGEVTLVQQVSEYISYELKAGDRGAVRVQRAPVEPPTFPDSSSSSSNNPPAPVCAYNAAVMKSTDSGKTWTTLFSDVSDFYPNEIDCASDTVCAFVGEGSSGASVYLSTDGKTFSRVYKSTSASYSLQTVRFVPGNPKEIFVAGSIINATGNKALLLHSTDGGQTWEQHADFDYLTEIIRMTFNKDGTGYAIAGTSFLGYATVLAYSPSGPPAPTSTPAPSYNGPVLETQCEDSACYAGCVNVTFPQNKCLTQPSGSGSYIAQCDVVGQVLKQTMFYFDTTCVGPSSIVYIPLNTCEMNSTGASMTIYCGDQ